MQQFAESPTPGASSSHAGSGLLCLKVNLGIPVSALDKQAGVGVGSGLALGSLCCLFVVPARPARPRLVNGPSGDPARPWGVFSAAGSRTPALAAAATPCSPATAQDSHECWQRAPDNFRRARRLRGRLRCPPAAGAGSRRGRRSPCAATGGLEWQLCLGTGCGAQAVLGPPSAAAVPSLPSNLVALRLLNPTHCCAGV